MTVRPCYRIETAASMPPTTIVNTGLIHIRE